MPSPLPPLPSDPPTPLGAYQAVVVRDGTGYVSGQFPIVDGQVVQPGRLGDPLDVDQGREAARAAALNVLAQIRRHLGSLDGVRLARVDGCIASVPGFPRLPEVLDAASETFVEYLGERGHHARGLIPVASLPQRAAIELLVVFQAG